jgi:hypothetical protein
LFGGLFPLPLKKVDHTSGSELTVKIRILASGGGFFDIHLMLFASISIYFV